MPRWLGPTLALAVLSACGATPPSARVASAPAPDIASPWAELADTPRVRVPLDDSPARGAESPLVTLVVFTDFECPFCQRLAPTLERLLAAHADELRMHHRHLPLPFHERAMPLAMAVEEARVEGGDDAFWAMHDRIFGDPSALSDDALLEHARALGLDATAFADAVRFQTHATRVEDDLMVADRIGARGTPTLFFNGRMVVGALSFEDLEALFQEERALAEEALERGIPRAQLYAAAMRDALEEAPPEPSRPQRPRRRLDRRVIFDVPIAGRPARGPVDALVTIVIFSDFECPWCADAVPVLEELDERYPGQLRWVFRHTPLPNHANARPAAAASMEAFAQRGDEGFWAMHDSLVENRRALEREDLIGYARELGLDVERFTRALDEGVHEAAIDDDIALARRLGARATPTFYVSGRIIQGAQPADYFSITIDDAIERARALLDSGTPPEQLYDALLENAATEAAYRQD